MWLTGFDVPCLSTLYLDKPLKAHTLMQAIARANRVNEGKNNGLIVDYCGILKHLRQALATFAGAEPGGDGRAIDPAKPEEDLLADLAEAIALVRDFLAKGGAPLDDVIGKTGFARNAAIVSCKEVANENDETRQRFEVMCREVFRKFKACINAPGVNDHRTDRDAIDIIYKSLQRDREQADISDILRTLSEVASEAIAVQSDMAVDRPLYDISRIDFVRLKQEFRRSDRRRTGVQGLKDTVEKKLQRMMERNPLRTDFQQRYEEIVAAYNREKDRPTIEQTFEELLDFGSGSGSRGKPGSPRGLGRRIAGDLRPVAETEPERTGARADQASGCRTAENAEGREAARESVARQGGDPRCRPCCDPRFPLERQNRLTDRRLLGSRSRNQDGRRIPARVPRLSNGAVAVLRKRGVK